MKRQVAITVRYSNSNLTKDTTESKPKTFIYLFIIIITKIKNKKIIIY